MIKENTFKLYGATFISFIYASSNMDTSFFTPQKSYEPSYRDMQITASIMDLKLVFESEDEISNFTSLLLSDKIINLGDKFNYHVSLSGAPVIKHISGKIYEVSYPLLTVKKGNLVRLQLSNKLNFVDVKGNYRTPCRYLITPDKDISDLDIDGHVINSLRSGSIIVFDGIDKLVTDDGLNKFGDVDLKNNHFPYLETGLQIVSLSDESIKVMLEYYPIYL